MTDEDRTTIPGVPDGWQTAAAGPWRLVRIPASGGLCLFYYNDVPQYLMDVRGMIRGRVSLADLVALSEAVAQLNGLPERADVDLAARPA